MCAKGINPIKKYRVKQIELPKKITLTIKYIGKLDTELDERLAGLLEFPPFNFNWTGQGYNLGERIRDISFERVDDI